MCIDNSYGCIRFYVFTLAVNPIPTLYICRTNVTKRIYYWLQKRTVLPFLFICWTISRNLVVIGLYITCNNLLFKPENVNYSYFYLAFKILRVWYFHKWHKWYSFWSIFFIFYFCCFYSSELTTDGNSTGVFSPVLLSGLCRYEVVYTNTSSVGKETVCFMIW